MKSASMYKTKACGVLRNGQSNGFGSQGVSNSKHNRGSIAPTSRVVIE